MLTEPVKCLHCGSADLVRNGHSKKGKQRFQCRACKKYGRENPSGNAYDQNTKALILAAYHERSSIRGLSRTFGVSRNTVAACGVSRNTVAAWLKKSP